MAKDITIKIAKWAFFFVIVFFVILLISGCTAEKKLLREKVKVSDNTITELKKENKLTKQDNQRLEVELKQAQYSGVTFDTVPCPPVNPPAIIVDENCNVDSVKAALESHYNSIYRQSVKVYADGTIEANGRLKAANYSLTTMQRIVAEKESRIDSFTTALLNEKKNIKTVGVIKDKWKKTAFQWWLLVLSFIAGAVVWERFGYQIKLFAKHFIKKW